MRGKLSGPHRRRWETTTPYSGQLLAGVKAVQARWLFCPSLLPSQHAAACRTRYAPAILVVMPTHKLTAEILNAAIEGFESQKRRIDVQIAELRQMLHRSEEHTSELQSLR